jgi:hypothetical protein
MRKAGGKNRFAVARCVYDIYMRSRAWVFAFFAAAMLFSVVREWSAPIGCPRLEMTGNHLRHC